MTTKETQLVYFDFKLKMTSEVKYHMTEACLLNIIRSKECQNHTQVNISLSEYGM